MFDFAPQRSEPLAVTVLRAARAMVATPEQWCQGEGHRGIAFCMGRALRESQLHVAGGECHALDLLLKDPCLDDVVVWNDTPGRTHAEVLAVFDAAIARGLAKSQETQTQRETVHV